MLYIKSSGGSRSLPLLNSSQCVQRRACSLRIRDGPKSLKRIESLGELGGCGLLILAWQFDLSQLEQSAPDLPLGIKRAKLIRGCGS